MSHGKSEAKEKCSTKKSNEALPGGMFYDISLEQEATVLGSSTRPPNEGPKSLAGKLFKRNKPLATSGKEDKSEPGGSTEEAAGNQTQFSKENNASLAYKIFKRNRALNLPTTDVVIRTQIMPNDASFYQVSAHPYW